MATGILAVAARQQGWPLLGLALFEFAGLAWLVLSLLSLWRLASQHARVLEDLRSHQRAPAFLTAVAGTGVLASGFLALDLGLLPRDRARPAALVVLWFVLTYAIFARLHHQARASRRWTRASAAPGCWRWWRRSRSRCWRALLAAARRPARRLQMNFRRAVDVAVAAACSTSG